MLPGKNIDPQFLLQTFRRRVWLVILPPLIGLFLALLYSSTQPDLYESQMLIAVDPPRVPDNIARSAMTLGTDRRLEALQVKVMSREALGKLVAEYDLYPEERKFMLVDDVVTKFRANLDMVMQIPRPRWGEEPQPTAFRVMFRYYDPQKAAQVTQRLGTFFMEQNLLERGAQAGATSDFIQSQLADARAKLEMQDKKLEAFRQRHGQELPTQMTSNMQALTSARTQVQSIVESLARDRDRKLMLERLYREAANERPVATVAADPRPGGAAPAPSSAQQQLANARGELADLETRYRPDHPDVLRARRRIDELEPKAAAEVASAAAAAAGDGAAALPVDANPTQRESLRQMRAEIESLDRQIGFKDSEERRVRAEIAEYQRRVEAVPGLESEWVALTRDYDTQQAAYKDLLTKSGAASLSSNLEEQSVAERFRVVDNAGVPVRPIPSRRIRYNAVGFFVGLLLGFGVVGFLEVRDKTFRTEGDVLDTLSLPVLAMVPYVETVSEKARGQRRRLVTMLGSATCAAVVGYVAWSMKLWNSLL